MDANKERESMETAANVEEGSKSGSRFSAQELAAGEVRAAHRETCLQALRRAGVDTSGPGFLDWLDGVMDHRSATEVVACRFREISRQHRMVSLRASAASSEAEMMAARAEGDAEGEGTFAGLAWLYRSLATGLR